MTPVPRTLTGRYTRALVLEGPDPSLDVELAALGIDVERLDEPPDTAALAEILRRGRHQLIFKRSRVPITEELIAASPELAAVMLCCIGDDSVDKEAAARHGVLVTNDPVSNGRSVAEMVIGELICLSRRIFAAVHEMDRSVWLKNNKQRYEVQGKSLGILGFGNIGRQVAQLARAMGITVRFYDTAEVPQEVGKAMGFEQCASIEELFGASDFVSVHVSASDHHGNTNEHLVSDAAFAAMGRRPANSPRIFLNLARGFVVDPAVLRRAAEAGHVTAAVVDVFPEEPNRGGGAWVNPFADVANVYATPHIGAATREAQPRIAHYVARTTQLLSCLGMIRNCVFNPRARIEFAPGDAAAMLAVVHVDARGTKKAVDDTIYDAGINNLRSAHIDFPAHGVAYDLSALDRALTPAECQVLATNAARLTGDETAIRRIRSIDLR